MSLRRSIPASILLASSWALLSVASAAGKPGASGPSATPPAPSHVSAGPTSAAEQEILWQDAKTAYDAGRFADAVPLLERLIGRYSAFPGFTEAHWMLANSYLKLREYEKALEPLRYYVAAKDRSIEGKHARIRLARAYIELGRFHEAILSTREVLKPVPADRVQSALYVEALLLRSEALIGLKHDFEAQQAVDSATRELAELDHNPHPEHMDLHGQAAWISLRLKSRKCSKLPSPGRLDEGQVRDQLGRRGDCLLEAEIFFLDAARAGAPEWADHAGDELSAGFVGFSHACSNPPLPPGKRTALELERYKKELALVLETDCQSKISKAKDILESSQEKLPTSTRPKVEQVAKQLSELRNP